MNIGLLLVNQEDDILAEILERHEQIIDCFYALDGTPDNAYSRDVLSSSEKCAGYLTDDEIGGPIVCGIRQVLHDLAVEEHGPDHCFLILHGDEIWQATPEEIIADHPGADGFVLRLPFYVPRDEWDYNLTPFEQLVWSFRPGWPEFRMFLGGEGVRYDRGQYMNTQPGGLCSVVWTNHTIKHYPYRSPESQRARATAGLDPDNYRHAAAGRFYWTDEMVAAAICNHHTHITRVEVPVA